MTETVVVPDAREETRARIEQAALDLFTAQGFERVTIGKEGIAAEGDGLVHVVDARTDTAPESER